MLVNKVSHNLSIRYIQYFVCFSLGYICIDILNKETSWTATTSLALVVEKTIEIMDTPSLDMIENVGQYDLSYIHFDIYFYFYRSSYSL